MVAQTRRYSTRRGRTAALLRGAAATNMQVVDTSVDSARPFIVDAAQLANMPRKVASRPDATPAEAPDTSEG